MTGIIFVSKKLFFFQCCVFDVYFSTLLCNLQRAAEVPLTGTPRSRSRGYTGMVRNFSCVCFLNITTCRSAPVARCSAY